MSNYAFQMIAATVVFVIVVCIALFAQYLVRQRTRQAMWLQLPGTPLLYAPNDFVDRDTLANAAYEAMVALWTVWPAAATVRALKGVRIRVVEHMPGTMGGVVTREDGHTVVSVARGLSMLAHEFAHICQERIDGRKDTGHKAWDERGIYAAETRYLEALGVT